MPAKKIIIDQELLDMHRKGFTRHQMSEHFGVSTTAINKRLKRLLIPTTVILDKYNLTEKERLFVTEKASGKTNAIAVMSAYDVASKESAKAMGTKLMDKPDVRLAIDDLMEAQGLGRAYRVQKLKGFVEHPDPNIGLKALQTAMKAGRDFPEQQVNITNQNISIYEILNRIEMEDRALGETFMQKLETSQEPFDTDMNPLAEGMGGLPPRGDDEG